MISRSSRPLLPWAALAVAVAVGYAWTLGAGFLGDDFGYVQRFWQFPLRAWPTLFVREWSEGIWGFPLRELRPVAALSLIVDGRLWAGHSAGYHLTNVLLHFACCGLVVIIAREVLPREPSAPVFAGLLFALHPVHAEPVTWVTGRVDILGTLGFLVAFYGLLRARRDAARRWLVLAWGGFAAGIFAKEFCLTLPFMALIFELSYPARARVRGVLERIAPYAGWAVLMGIYYACRVTALGPGVGAPPLQPGTLAFGEALAQRELTYVAYVFWPLAGHLPVSDGARETALTICVATLVATIGASLLWIRYDRRRDAAEARAALTFGIAWWLVGTLPFVVTYVSSRHLYLASAGLCIAAVAVLTRILSNRVVFATACGLMVIACAVELRSANAPWRDASRLSMDSLHAIDQVAARAEPGEVLLIDAPGAHQGSWVWAWASPFALKPPFQSRDLTRDLIVLERNDVYFHPEQWSAHPSIARVAGYRGRVWLISSLAGRMTAIEIPASVAAPTLAELDLPLGVSGSFQRLVADLIHAAAS